MRMVLKGYIWNCSRKVNSCDRCIFQRNRKYKALRRKDLLFSRNMISGIITAVAFVLTALKFITARAGSQKIDHFALTVHRYAAVILIISTAVHIITVWKLRAQRPTGMLVIGIVMAAAVLTTLLSHAFSQKFGMKWIVIHRIAALVILLCLIIHIVYGTESLAAYKKAIAQLPDEPEIDLSEVPDGTYYGECDAGYVEAYVRVTVHGGKLTDVTILRHRTERGKAAEALAGEMVTEQNTDADAISSATCSSKVIKEAVYRALTE